MYMFLNRRHRKLSNKTLFTPFGLQMNKLEAEKRGKKGTSWSILKITHFSKFQKCFFWPYLDSTLSQLSNEMKITKKGVQMKKLWLKQNWGKNQESSRKFSQYCENFATLQIFATLRIFAIRTVVNFFFENKINENKNKIKKKEKRKKEKGTSLRKFANFAKIRKLCENSQTLRKFANFAKLGSFAKMGHFAGVANEIVYPLLCSAPAFSCFQNLLKTAKK